MIAKSRLPNVIAYGCILALALYLILPHVPWLAVIGPDASEFIYCVEHHCLPHSPYLLFMWAGFLLKPFIRLDWGYSALSTVSALASIVFLGLTVERLHGSRVAGWTTALVMAIFPIAIRYAGLQEIYAMQLFMLSAAWWFASGGNSVGCGLALGASLATHSGSLFAFPATLWIYSQSRRPWREWFHLTAAGALPNLLVLLWLAAIWVSSQGLSALPLLPLVLRGASPLPQWSVLFHPGGVDFFEKWMSKVWVDMTHFEVIGAGLCWMGGVALLLQPLRVSAPWWLLSLPYLLYEATTGTLLDWGIFWVFVAPGIAVGLGLGLASFPIMKKQPLHQARFAVSVVGLLCGFSVLPAFQKTAEIRDLLPWYRATGEQMALCDWVRENTPADTLVIQPSDWSCAGLASALYTDRIPVFNTYGMLNPGPWRPLNVSQAFGDTPAVTTGMFETWLKEERPFVCFDADPFHSWLSFWPFVDTDRYEARPILWLDQNQTGTSAIWEGPERTALVHLGSPTEETAFQVEYPDSAQKGALELPLFHPTLYQIARKADPLEAPGWSRELQSHVPESQRGAVPVLKRSGIAFKAIEGDLSMTLPVIPGRNHALRLLLQSGGADYIVECQVWFHRRWYRTGLDMERITIEPKTRFSELYFPIPAKFVQDRAIKLRLVPVDETPLFNAYEVELAAVRGAG
jgi:hypothetical protein